MFLRNVVTLLILLGCQNLLAASLLSYQVTDGNEPLFAFKTIVDVKEPAGTTLTLAEFAYKTDRFIVGATTTGDTTILDLSQGSVTTKIEWKRVKEGGQVTYTGKNWNNHDMKVISKSHGKDLRSFEVFVSGELQMSAELNEKKRILQVGEAEVESSIQIRGSRFSGSCEAHVFKCKSSGRLKHALFKDEIELVIFFLAPFNSLWD